MCSVAYRVSFKCCKSTLFRGVLTLGSGMDLFQCLPRAQVIPSPNQGNPELRDLSEWGVKGSLFKGDTLRG